ncbi:MAG TPA: hypothetical protein VMW38_13920, partial [Terriglobia bacterium]|nr:hypothetical protein [Terriglobia bacterium]
QVEPLGHVNVVPLDAEGRQLATSSSCPSRSSENIDRYLLTGSFAVIVRPWQDSTKGYSQGILNIRWSSTMPIGRAQSRSSTSRIVR